MFKINHKLSTLLPYSGITTVAILWVSILTALYKGKLSLFGRMPLSHLGTIPASAPYFSIGLIMAASTLLAFGFFLSRSYSLVRSFAVILLIGQLGQIVAALAPYGGQQPARIIHTYAAFILAFSIPLLMWRFAASQNSALRNRSYHLLWLEIVSFLIGIGTFAFIYKGSPIGQIMPALAFHVWIIVISQNTWKLNKATGN